MIITVSDKIIEKYVSTKKLPGEDEVLILNGLLVLRLAEMPFDMYDPWENCHVHHTGYKVWNPADDRWEDIWENDQTLIGEIVKSWK